MPQSMSRVIARGRISLRMFWLKRITLGRHSPVASRSSSHSPSASASAGRSRKKCWVSMNSGVSPLIFETGFDQVGRVELVAAVVALVAARAVVPADRAGALDVAVGQRAAGRRRDGAVRRLLDEVAVLVDPEEQLLDDGVVVAASSCGCRGRRCRPSATRSSAIIRWLCRRAPAGSRPASSAAIRIGVPCSSEPETMSTSCPAIRMYRLKTSEGTPKPATWPMWRGPLAYGQATADRTWVMP